MAANPIPEREGPRDDQQSREKEGDRADQRARCAVNERAQIGGKRKQRPRHCLRGTVAGKKCIVGHPTRRNHFCL